MNNTDQTAPKSLTLILYLLPVIPLWLIITQYMGREGSHATGLLHQLRRTPLNGKAFFFQPVTIFFDGTIAFLTTVFPLTIFYSVQSIPLFAEGNREDCEIKYTVLVTFLSLKLDSPKPCVPTMLMVVTDRPPLEHPPTLWRWEDTLWCDLDPFLPLIPPQQFQSNHRLDSQTHTLSNSTATPEKACWEY